MLLPVRTGVNRQRSRAAERWRSPAPRAYGGEPADAASGVMPNDLLPVRTGVNRTPTEPGTARGPAPRAYGGEPA